MKPPKNVLLLITLHSPVNIGNNKKTKPETIEFYNNTKYGVGVLDQMARNYSRLDHVVGRYKYYVE